MTDMTKDDIRYKLAVTGHVVWLMVAVAALTLFVYRIYQTRVDTIEADAFIHRVEARDLKNARDIRHSLLRWQRIMKTYERDALMAPGEDLK